MTYPGKSLNPLYGAVANAQAYFTAAITSTTPELRSFLSSYCTQSMTGHEAMMNYMIQKNWSNPYDQPDSQLAKAVQESASSNNTH